MPRRSRAVALAASGALCAVVLATSADVASAGIAPINPAANTLARPSAAAPAAARATGAHHASRTRMSWPVIGRYVVGHRHLRDQHGWTWTSDAPLGASGHTVTQGPRNRRAFGPLWAHSRHAARPYHIRVRRSGVYAVSFRYLRCTHRGCARTQATVFRILAHPGVLAVRPPAAANRAGVTNLFVSRRQPAPKGGGGSGGVPITQPGGIWGSKNAFEQDISKAPLATNSPAMSRNLVSQAEAYYDGVAAFNAYRYNVTWYTVPASQPTVRVAFSNCQNKPSVPDGLFGAGGQFENVPMPAGAIASVGTDASITVYRPSTDQLWDFWNTFHDGAGWHACWGGRIDHLSSSYGYFANGFGATATGIASEAGDISLNDVRSGSIDHAVTLAIPSPADWTRFSWPAQRSDGGDSGSNAIPEGTRLRLDPSVDVASLHLSPIATMIARAAQKYGFIVTDRAGCLSVIAESGIPTQLRTGVDPWKSLLGNVPDYLVMQGFPWRHIQVLPQNYGKPRD